MSANKNSDFQLMYRRAYANLDRPLTGEDGIDADLLNAVEYRLKIKLPQALRDFYLVAGEEQEFICSQDRLLQPEELFIDNGRLVFFVENQAMVFWGITATSEMTIDPPVEMGTNNKPVEWAPQNDHCSVFLMLWLHWQAAHKMPWKGRAELAETEKAILDRDWQFLGESSPVQVYIREGQVICISLMEKKYPPCWEAFAGAATPSARDAVLNSLPVRWRK